MFSLIQNVVSNVMNSDLSEHSLKEFKPLPDDFVIENGHYKSINKICSLALFDFFIIIKASTTVNELYDILKIHKFSRLSLIDQQNENFLNAAIVKGNVKLVEAILDAAPELVNLETVIKKNLGEDWYTPLFVACNSQKPDLQIIELLINKGANVNFTCKIHYFIDTPFALAVRSKHEQLTQLLLNHNAKLVIDDGMLQVFNEKMEAENTTTIDSDNISLKIIEENFKLFHLDEPDHYTFMFKQVQIFSINLVWEKTKYLFDNDFFNKDAFKGTVVPFLYDLHFKFW